MLPACSVLCAAFGIINDDDDDDDDDCTIYLIELYTQYLVQSTLSCAHSTLCRIYIKLCT